MSSYLNIYLRNKKTKEKTLLLDYSRNNQVYIAFNEAGCCFAYSNKDDDCKEQNFTIIDFDFINRIISKEEYSIQTLTKHLIEYEKYASGNEEIIQTIISYKETINEHDYVLAKCYTLKDMIETLLDYSSDYELICNIA